MLYGANLQDAAICMPLPSDSTKSNGVWLYEVKAGDPLYAMCLNELNQGAQLFSMDPQNEADLQPGTVSSAFQQAFAAASNGPSLSASAQVAVEENSLTYQIVDGGVSYVFITGFDDSGTVAYQVLPSSNAVKPFTVPLADGNYLKPGSVPDPLQQDMKKGGVTLSAKARISSFQRAVIWQINDTQATYTLWDGFDYMSYERQLIVRPAILNLESLFTRFGITLKRTQITAGTGTWSVDNDSANPFNFTLGYVIFNVVQGSQNGPLDVFGSTMRIESLTDNNQLQFNDLLSNPTQMSAANFDPNTIYPNGNKETIVSGQLMEAWMRARVPPRPPNCVYTSGYYYCPITRSQEKEHLPLQRRTPAPDRS
jgi:hypothetical protein